MTSKSRLVMSMLIAVVLLSAAGLSASAADAATERFMRYQGLSAGNVKASEAAHSGSLTVGASADHSFCPSLARGYAGYTSTPNSSQNITVASQYCGPGYQGTSWNGTSDFWHGAVWNKNQSTYDNFSYADFSW